MPFDPETHESRAHKFVTEMEDLICEALKAGSSRPIFEARNRLVRFVEELRKELS